MIYFQTLQMLLMVLHLFTVTAHLQQIVMTKTVRHRHRIQPALLSLSHNVKKNLF